LHSTKWSNGKKKKGWNNFPQKKSNLTQDSGGNEENGYPVPDSNKIIINDIRNPVTSRKHTQRRNLARNHGEFHREDIRHG
jgi:hypothetical protein